ncbi:hypothetical protein [Actinophytocola sp.]|uniref:hypothetical protein n=1 Tax=Actinophytocola sp. TaxID=1872138 RepID=UPI0025C050AF|nr:hypothetical protein [Actinophytocola sp.]
MSRYLPRARSMSGVTRAMENFSCAPPPWSVMTTQSRPYSRALATWVATSYCASGEYLVWRWWSPAYQRSPPPHSLPGLWPCPVDAAAGVPETAAAPAAAPAMPNPARESGRSSASSRQLPSTTSGSCAWSCS